MSELNKLLWQIFEFGQKNYRGAASETIEEIHAELNRRAPAAEQQQQEPVVYMREGATEVMHNFRFDKPGSGPWVPLCKCQQPQAQGENEKIKSALNEALAEIKILSTENAELRARRFARFNNEECWIYQGDGKDYLESLGCPVVISAVQLIEILKPRAAVPDVKLYRDMLLWLYEQQMKALVEPIMEFDEWLWKIGNEMTAAPAQLGEGE